MRTATVLGLGGAGFAIGNVLLARVLPAAEFGKVSLLLALIQVGGALGAPGIPMLIYRHHWSATPRLLGACVVSAAMAGAATGWVAHELYGFAPMLTLLLAAAVALAALGRVAGAFFQSRERFGVSLLLSQSLNWLLLASVPFVVLLGRPQASTVAAVLVVSCAVTTGFGLRLAADSVHGAAAPLARERLLAEGLSAAGLMLAGNLLFQLDRLLIGALLALQELAAYSVVAVIAGSAFRMLQVGAGHSLAPRLRGCKSRSAVLRLIAAEGVTLGAVGLLAALLIVLLTPWLMSHFLAARYDASVALMLTIIAIGFVRLWEAIVSAVVSALGSTNELSLLTVLSWIAVAVSTACAAWAARFGLLGVVLGLGAGWCVLALGASTLAARAWSRLA